MTEKVILLAALLGAALLISCQPKGAASAGNGGATVPPPPTAEVLAALNAQTVGKRLLGNTRLLVGEEFVRADLQSAPEFYIVHFSASW